MTSNHSTTKPRRFLDHASRFGVVGAMLGATLALGLTTSQPAQAADPNPSNCLNTLYLTDSASGNVYPVDFNGNVSTTAEYDATPGASATTPNQLGIGKGGAYAINTAVLNGTASIVQHTFATGTTTTTTKQLAAGVSGIAGSIDPANQDFYYGGYTSSASPLVLWEYNPTTNTSVGPVASITVPSAPTGGGNGDIAFGADGTLYFVASSASQTNLYRVDDFPTTKNTATPSTTPTYTAELLTSTPVSAAANGIAFGSDGYLYLGTAKTITKVNPITGNAIGTAKTLSNTSITSTDLGTCAGPTTTETDVNLPDGRLTPGDQFTTTVTGGSYANPPTFPSGTTTGTDSGVQNQPAETAGPGILIPGETYTSTITGAGTTNVNDYAVSYTCVDQDGNTTRSGQGTSYTITPTAGTGTAETCTFLTQNPVDLQKTVSPTTYNSVGDTLTYTFAVTNRDSQDLNNFQLQDGLTGLGPVTCTPYVQGGTIPAGQSTTCTANYTITQADIQNGATKTNTASVTGNARSGSTRTTSDTSSVSATNNSVALTATDDTANTPYRTPVNLPASNNDTAGTSTVVNNSTIFTATNQPASATISNGGKTLVDDDGTYQVQTNGTVTFTPANTFVGTVTPVTYQVSDTNGYTDTATLTVTVRTGPTSTADTVSTPQNTNVTINPFSNDTPGPNADGTTGTFDPTSVIFPNNGQPTSGVVTNAGKTLTVSGEGVYTINATTGAVTFDPDTTFRGTATPVTYQVTDNHTNTTSNTITITVRSINPSTINDTANTPFNTAVTLAGETNDNPGTDDNGTPNNPNDDTTPALVPASTVFPVLNQPASAVISNGGKTLTDNDGVYQVNNSGTITYTPANTFTGATETVTYRIGDVNGSTATGTLNVTVRSAPTATVDTPSTPQNVNGTINPFANDTPGPNADGTAGTFDPASVIFTTANQPASAVVTNGGKTLTDNDGVYTINTTTGVVTFDPVSNLVGNAQPVTYQVTDSHNNTTSSTITFTVRGINPTATDDTANTSFNTAVTLAGETNDNPGTDDNGTPNNPNDDTTPALVPANTVFPTNGQPTGASVTNNGKTLTATNVGEFDINNNGTITFTPVTGYSGTTDPYVYRIEDMNGTTATGTVTVTVRTGPTSTADTASTRQNVNVDVNPFSNDTPGPNADGNAGTFDPASVVFTTANQPASAVVTNGGKTLTDNDGVYTINTTTGVVTFNPNTNFTGVAEPVNYRVTDNHTNTTSNTITVTVRPVAPTATDDTASVTYGNGTVFPGATNDTPGVDDNGTPNNPNDDVTINIDPTLTVFPTNGQPTGASVTNNGKTLTIVNVGEFDINNNGTITFTPVTGYSGTTDPVVYQITDQDGVSDTATLVFTGQPGPIARNDDNISTPQNVNKEIRVLENDTPGPNADGTPGSFVTSDVTFPTTNPGVVSNNGYTLTVNGEGVYTVDPNTGYVTFDPDAVFIGPATPVTYQAVDSYGNSATATISVTVTAIKPTATDDKANTRYNQPVTLAGETNDQAGAPTAPLVPAATLFTFNNQPANSSVSNGGKTLTTPNQGVWNIQTDGSVIFTPTAGFTGTAGPVTYQISDSNGTTDTGTLTVTVEQGPQTAPDYTTTKQNVNVTLNPLDNDKPAVDTDGTTTAIYDKSSLQLVVSNNLPAGSNITTDGKTLTVPGQGVYTVNPDGTITFNPEASFTGTVTPVVYQITDSFGNTATSTITVAIEGVTPKAVNDKATTPFNKPVNIDVLANDVPGQTAVLDPTTLHLIDPVTGQPTNIVRIDGKGTWTVVDGKVKFTPDDGFSGTVPTITYQVSDVNGTTTTATISVTVKDGPTVTPGTSTTIDAVTTMGDPITINIIDSVTPADNEKVIKDSVCLLPSTVTVDGKKVKLDIQGKCVKIVQVPGVGVYTVKPNGTVVFTPVKGFTGHTTIDYQVTDTGGFTYQNTIKIHVKAPNNNDNNGNNGNNDNGGNNNDDNNDLPNTGGFPFYWILLGGLTLIAGTVFITNAKRRKNS